MDTRAVTIAVLSVLALAPGASAQMLNKQALSANGARKIVQACEAEAAKNGWLVSIAVVDEAGQLVQFSRMDGAGFNTIEVAQGKARTSVITGKPSKVFMDRLLAGETQLLAFPNALPMQGGLPLIVGGRAVAAVGVSGAQSAQDEQCAQVGLDALNATQS